MRHKTSQSDNIENNFITKEVAIIASTFSILVIIVGIIGNILTIIALVKGSPNLQSHATTKFIVNLAVSDLMFSALNLPLTTVRYMTRSWPFGSFLCHWFPFFFYGNVATSLMSIACITINRFVFIAYNARYSRIYTKLNVCLMICFCWCFSFGLMMFPLLGIWGRFGLKVTTFSCTILADTGGHSPKKFLFVFGFVFPITVITICYTIIWIHVRRQSRNTLKTTKRDLRLTKLIFIIFGAFVMCFAPNTIANVLISESEYPYIHVLSSMLCWLNSCINPFIYFAMNAKYRRALKRVLAFGTHSSGAMINESIVSQSDQIKSSVIYCFQCLASND
ncbi:G-protein coupled receptor moody-like [Oppia nitens]|uniref:G-protein coupled receptor moody-like n=1 Tax=Oppia nitens TaxID=1686743 RepID=UPI0023DB196C|nr:G-protein coupled receptor moody-like [Oppia nitens]